MKDMKLQKKQYKRILRYSILGVIIVGIAAGTAWYVTRPEAVRTAQMTQGDITQTVTGDGIITSNEITVYYASVSAPIAQMKLKVGDTVTSGETLVSYDQEDLEKDYTKSTLEQAVTEASQNAVLEDNNKLNQKLADAATQYEQACIYEEFFQDAVDQMEDQLYDISLVEQEYDDLKAEVDRAQAVLQYRLQETDPDEDDIDDANEALLGKQMKLNDKEKELAKYDRASIEECMADCQQELTNWKEEKERQRTKKDADDNTLTGSGIQETAAVKKNAEFDVEEAQKELEKGQQGITATQDGVITSLMVNEGETVADGTELFTIENDKDVCVRVDLSKYDMAQVAVGQKAQITIGNFTYEGSVSRIDQKADTDNANKPKVYVEVTIQNPDEHVYLGLEADVTIDTDTAEEVNIVPFEAVYEQDGGSFVYVIRDGKIAKQQVTTGLTDNSFIQITEGLQENESVILDAVTDEDIGHAVLAR